MTTRAAEHKMIAGVFGRLAGYLEIVPVSLDAGEDACERVNPSKADFSLYHSEGSLKYTDRVVHVILTPCRGVGNDLDLEYRIRRPYLKSHCAVLRKMRDGTTLGTGFVDLFEAAPYRWTPDHIWNHQRMGLLKPDHVYNFLKWHVDQK